MTSPASVPQRQLQLGPAQFFRPEAFSPATNQIKVRKGFAASGGLTVIDQSSSGDQTTSAFSVVTTGNQRYDLVYLDASGVAQIAQGTAVAAGTSGFQGAPGYTGSGTQGPDMPDPAVPVAWVFVDETSSVVIMPSDITQLDAIFRVNRDLDGYFVDKGNTGSVPASGSQVVTSLFSSESPNGTTSAPFARGVVTTSPNNLINLFDQKGEQIIHAAEGSRIFGRLTYAGGVWTLTYRYLDSSGTEQTVGNMTTDTTLAGGLTNIHLVGVPKVYSRHDPSRPMFSTGIVPSSMVAGDIPTATTTEQGKVLAALAGAIYAGAIAQVKNAGTTLVGAGLGGGFSKLNFLGGAAINGGDAAQVDVTATTVQIHYEAPAAAGSGLSYTVGFVPKAAIFISGDGSAEAIGLAIGSLSGQQCALQFSDVANGVPAAGYVGAGGSTQYAVTAWGSTVTITRSLGTGNVTFAAIFIG